jgi:transcriptional regulator with XRE-family HTH domain
MANMFDPDDLADLQKVRALGQSGALRLVRGTLSLRDIAESVGVAPSTILRWERGERVPHGTAALRYGRLLQKLMQK